MPGAWLMGGKVTAHTNANSDRLHQQRLLKSANRNGFHRRPECVERRLSQCRTITHHEPKSDDDEDPQKLGEERSSDGGEGVLA